MQHYDVIVLGGGTAGFMAAAASARQGAKTLLIERFPHLGGTAVYGIPFLGVISGGGKVVNRGMVDELIGLLEERGDCFGYARGAYWNTPARPDSYEFSLVPFDPEGLKYAAQRLVAGAGCEVLLNTFLCGARVENGRLCAVEAVNKSGRATYGADVFVDATGDADAVFLAGGRFQEKTALQNASILFRVGGVDLAAFRAEMERGETVRGKGAWHTRILYQSKAPDAAESLVHMAGHFAPFDDKTREVTFTAVSLRDGEVFLNATRVSGVDGTDAVAVSRAELLERENVMELIDALRRNVRGFERAVLLATSPLGIRESRNILGDYTITRDDVLSAVKFPDGVACGAYPIDIHDPRGGKTQFQFIREGGYYTIPYRAMLPAGLEGVLVCGRCISAAHEAHGTTRIMGCVLSQGEAAGTAAALASVRGVFPRALPAEDVRAALRFTD